jgi:hypothetical protein
MITESNDVLRSVYAVICRKGKSTNWDALEEKVREELLFQAGLPSDTGDDQLLLRATCTAKTFKKPRNA